MKQNLLILLWKKLFRKKIKTIKDQGKKQVDVLNN